jgi:hypothetical protein
LQSYFIEVMKIFVQGVENSAVRATTIKALLS